MYFILPIGLIGLSPAEHSIDFEELSRVPFSYQVRLLLKKSHFIQKYFTILLKAVSEQL